MIITITIFISLIIMEALFCMLKDRRKKIKFGLIYSEIIFIEIFFVSWKIQNKYWYLIVLILLLIQMFIELIILKKVINNNKRKKTFWNINLIYKILLISLVLVQNEPLIICYFL